MNRALLRPAAALAAALLLAPSPARGQAAQTEYEGAAALGLTLRKLGNTKRVLMIGAHPDDENTQILSTLALGQGAEVGYLSLTRGEGGQNGIGGELGEALGLLRTEELLAARRLDGARQFFTRAYDYGFSKDAAEAFRHWPRDSLLADVVAVIREFRPDVIISVFSGTPSDGHGQHQAAGILAREGFEAAAGPSARGLGPFVVPKLYQALWSRDQGAAERLSTGRIDPILGRSHHQVAMASRGRHRSQDMGRELTAGPQTNALRLIAHRGVGADSSSLFAGVDTTLAQELLRFAAADSRGSYGDAVRLFDRYQETVAEVRASFNPLYSSELVPTIAAAIRLLDAACDALPTGRAHEAFLQEVRDERAELSDALALASLVQVDALSSVEAAVPGQTLEVTLSVWNSGSSPAEVLELAPALPAGWTAKPLDPLPPSVAPNTLAARRFEVSVPGNAPSTEPYFLRAPRRGDVYLWDGPSAGRPFDPPVLSGIARLALAGVEIERRRAVAVSVVDKITGESRRPVRIVPAVSAIVEPALAVVPLSAERQPLEFSVQLRSDAPRGTSGTLHLRAPEGWAVSADSVPVRFSTPGEVRTVKVLVTPPRVVAEGKVALEAEFRAADGRRYSRGYRLVDYPHVEPRPVYRAATAEVRALDVRLPPDLRVGYVAGPGDPVPAALSQLGVRLELLDAPALASADLTRFDAIVTGSRAYELRHDLVAHNRRLLDYVQGGGTLIVQYNKYEFTEPGLAPFPLEMARPHDRVTDEAAEVRLLAPDHPALSHPNRITAEDFEGWQQERGLYFLSRWDPAYLPLLEMADPGEVPSRGALLVARHGKGTYVYTGLALFRQLPAGVPGAYRLFANLLSLGVRP